jgi:hypothetical protein
MPRYSPAGTLFDYRKDALFMIITRLIGGLGNQLFQYAAARRISYVNNVTLKLDITGFGNYKLRSYRLNNFNIVENIATIHEITKIKKGRILGRIDNFLPYYIRSNIKPKNMNFDERILERKNNIYLDGYWQSEKYFEDIRDVISKEFTIKSDMDESNRLMAEQIEETNSVSIHVRRGDYATDAKTNQFHGLCGLDYYSESIKRMNETIDNPHFFIFSDDPNWVKDNIKIQYPTIYVTHNGPDRDYEDLRLISLCKHHIIANSSFSWWGAWLCKSTNKKVIAPMKWFNSDENNEHDILPDNWTRI